MSVERRSKKVPSHTICTHFSASFFGLSARSEFGPNPLSARFRGHFRFRFPDIGTERTDGYDVLQERLLPSDAKFHRFHPPKGFY